MGLTAQERWKMHQLGQTLDILKIKEAILGFEKKLRQEAAGELLLSIYEGPRDTNRYTKNKNSTNNKNELALHCVKFIFEDKRVLFQPSELFMKTLGNALPHQHNDDVIKYLVNSIHLDYPLPLVSNSHGHGVISNALEGGNLDLVRFLLHDDSVVRKATATQKEQVLGRELLRLGMTFFRSVQVGISTDTSPRMILQSEIQSRFDGLSMLTATMGEGGIKASALMLKKVQIKNTYPFLFLAEKIPSLKVSLFLLRHCENRQVVDQTMEIYAQLYPQKLVTELQKFKFLEEMLSENTPIAKSLFEHHTISLHVATSGNLKKPNVYKNKKM